MAERAINVLFLCTANSSCSILAESILKHFDKERFNAFSAGCLPAGKVDAFALELLEKMHYPTSGLHSKSVEEFAASDAPRLDFVLTVCDDAAQSIRTVWAGQPMTAHWGVENVSAAKEVNEAKRYAILAAFRVLRRRIGLFVGLPIDRLDTLALRRRLNAIGQVL